jgi:hypothetical protein
MAVLDAVQTFAGIANENEFYSHHYLAEVFKGDIKARLDAWDAAETEHPGDDAYRTPNRRLQAWSQRWFSLRGQIQRARDDAERWDIFTQIQSGLLQALGYAAPPDLPIQHELVPGLPIPMWHLQMPRLAIIPAYQPGAENEDLLDHKLQSRHYGGEPVPKHLLNETWADMLSDAVFGADIALQALHDPFQNPHVFAEARPEEASVGGFPKPIDLEHLRRILKSTAKVQPMPEITSHVIAAERQHGHRIPSHLTNSPGGRCSGLAAHGGPQVDPVHPIEGLVNQRQRCGAPPAENDGGNGNAFSGMGLGREGRIVRHRSREAGVGMGGLFR